MAVYEFGPFRLDPVERLLLRGGESIPLKPKAFDLLVLLVARHGRLITKQELMDALWPATAVARDAAGILGLSLHRARLSQMRLLISSGIL